MIHVTWEGGWVYKRNPLNTCGLGTWPHHNTPPHTTSHHIHYTILIYISAYPFRGEPGVWGLVRVSYPLLIPPHTRPKTGFGSVAKVDQALSKLTKYYQVMINVWSLLFVCLLSYVIHVASRVYHMSSTLINSWSNVINLKIVIKFDKMLIQVDQTLSHVLTLIICLTTSHEHLQNVITCDHAW